LMLWMCCLSFAQEEKNELGLLLGAKFIPPSRQLRQRPQAMLNGTETKSPTFKNSTWRPFSMISPVI